MLKFTEEELDTIKSGLDLIESQVSIGGSFLSFENKLSNIRRKINDHEAKEMGKKLYRKDK